MLFSSPDLGAVAEAVAAQVDVDPSSIYATLDGKSRSLSKDKRIDLFARVLDARRRKRWRSPSSPLSGWPPARTQSDRGALMLRVRLRR